MGPITVHFFREMGNAISSELGLVACVATADGKEGPRKGIKSGTLLGVKNILFLTLL